MAESKKNDRPKTGTRTRMSVPRPNLRKGKAVLESSRITRTMIKLCLIIAALMIIIGIWRSRIDLHPVNMVQCARDIPAMTGGGDGYPMSIHGGNTLQLDQLAGGIAVLSDSTTSVLNRSGKEAVNSTHSMTNPGMKTAGRYALVFDIGQKKARLETAAGTLSTASTEYPIISGAVSRKGDFALVTKGSTHSASMISDVNVYDRKGEWTYKYHHAMYYINDAALSGNGKYLAVSGISAEEGKLKSVVMVYRVGEEKPRATLTQQDNIFLALEFTSADTLYCIGDKVMLVVDDYGESYATVNLAGELMAYDIEYDCGAAVYTSLIQNIDTGNLQVFDVHGQLRFSEDVPLYGTAVSLDAAGCCVLGRGKMNGYRLSGELFGEWDVGITASDVELIDREAYVSDGIIVSHIHIAQVKDDE
ncbi:MAG: hypothetical protein E7559_05465 [Ruminococcaceae bacterium]|nr:hypothetical protein [Oscillospiraceae bacterium]